MVLRLEQISKHYLRPGGGDRCALDQVSLEVSRGEILGIFGPSGSGKTTLLRIAAGLQRPSAGTVTYNGERLDEMSASERTRFRRREIACVWAAQPEQERLSVLDHVALPLLVDRRNHRAAERRAREALLVCEAEQCAGMELHELSDGERRRVAIARALATEPRLLLADGPSANLSVIEQDAVMALLSSLAREAKVAVLITDYDAAALIRADSILYLCEGKLVNSEPPDNRGRIYHFPPDRAHRVAADA
jgi:putative ABC transport system ATP-binding protein